MLNIQQITQNKQMIVICVIRTTSKQKSVLCIKVNK